MKKKSLYNGQAQFNGKPSQLKKISRRNGMNNQPTARSQAMNERKRSTDFLTICLVEKLRSKTEVKEPGSISLPLKQIC